MIVVDTNVISEFTRQRPDPAVLAWFGRMSAVDLYLCTPVLAEIVYGLERLRLRGEGDRRIRDTSELLARAFSPDVLLFDERSARACGEVRAAASLAGNARSKKDMLIAGICLANDASVATRNVSDFAETGVSVVNPFEAS